MACACLERGGAERGEKGKDPTSRMSPKWGFGLAVLLVGALYFYWAQVGHIVLPNEMTNLGASLLQCLYLCFRHYEARNDYANDSEIRLLCNGCVRNWRITSHTINV